MFADVIGAETGKLLKAQREESLRCVPRSKSCAPSQPATSHRSMENVMPRNVTPEELNHAVAIANAAMAGRQFDPTKTAITLAFRGYRCWR